MASPNEKLAASLDVLRDVQEDVGPVIKSGEISRTHRTRLVKAGYLTDVIKGWLINTRPSDRPGDTTFWYISFWDFCKRYCNDRFGDAWCLSPEHSLLRHADGGAVPDQVIIWAPAATGDNQKLPYKTSLYGLKKQLPEPNDRVARDGLNLLTIEASLIKVTEAFYQNHRIEAQIALSAQRQIAPLLAQLLDGGHVNAAGRIAGALRRMGRDDDADQILKKMKAAGYDVRERDPFNADMAMPNIKPGTPPLVSRLENAWATQRQAVIDHFPDPMPLPIQREDYLTSIDEMYSKDAYNSLSIEGYRVTPDLIEKVRHGGFDPINNPKDKEDQDALAARGYWQAFCAVRVSIDEIINGGNAGLVVRKSQDDWYSEMFQPSVDAGILKPGVLAGYRNHPVYLRGSRHTPPRVEAVIDGMDALFMHLENEPHPAVKAVLGHWLFGYVHPYPDGNGRMARFLMNAMMASGGYPWTIVRLEDRAEYMAALETASTEINAAPFAAFLSKSMERSMA